jgi:hypothetical protein
LAWRNLHEREIVTIAIGGEIAPNVNRLSSVFDSIPGARNYRGSSFRLADAQPDFAFDPQSGQSFTIKKSGALADAESSFPTPNHVLTILRYGCSVGGGMLFVRKARVALSE